jgi:cysteine desulfurase
MPPDARHAEILERLQGVAASTGSACHSGRIEPPPVLEAMGIAHEAGVDAVRFSLGRETRRDEIDEVVQRVTNMLAGVCPREWTGNLMSVP